MRGFEKMIEGVGFYYDSRQGLDSLPSLNECVEMVRELAYHKWQQAGSPHGCDMEFWLRAEKELFKTTEEGFAFYICDLADRKNQGFFRHYDRMCVAPQGRKILK